MADESIEFLNELWLSNERGAIQVNARVLDDVRKRVIELESLTRKQDDELVHLRATVIGLTALIQRKLDLQRGEIDQEVKIAYDELVPPPVVKPSSDPYRGLPEEARKLSMAQRDDNPEAKQLMKQAQDLHFSKQFADARVIYQEIVERFPSSKQALVAAQQIENLEGQ